MHLEHDVVGSDHEHTHTHEHTHEHTHANGETHQHAHTHEHCHSHGHDGEHTHDHAHDSEHAHEHTHGHEHSHDEGGADNRLFALMNYMAGHNADHTKELAELAVQLKDSGKESAYDKVMAAVEEFNKGNALLAEALQEMN